MDIGTWWATVLRVAQSRTRLKGLSMHRSTDHLCMAAGRKNLTHPLPKACQSRRCLQELWAFCFSSSPLPYLFSIIEPGMQIPIRWLFWDIILHLLSQPAFPTKYSLPQHLFSDSLVCPAMSRGILDSVTTRCCLKKWFNNLKGMLSSTYVSCTFGFSC